MDRRSRSFHGVAHQEAAKKDAQTQVSKDAQEIPTAAEALSVVPQREVWIGEEEGRTALYIDGVVQSVAVPESSQPSGYWPLMLPEARPRSALLLGLGGGTIAHLLVRRFGPVPITAVENDTEVLRLAPEAFGLMALGIDLIPQNAFDFVGATAGPYDYIAVDLFSDGRVSARIFGRPFLRRLKVLASPGGLVAVNFFRDRRALAHQHRLARVFPRVNILESGKNLVAHCRPR